jgi:F0F1-type ATP synthase membrane subunit c/vacuolar-type H+-ATPase subunit K
MMNVILEKKIWASPTFCVLQLSSRFAWIVADSCLTVGIKFLGSHNNSSSSRSVPEAGLSITKQIYNNTYLQYCTMESTVPSILAGLGVAFAVGLSASGTANATQAAALYFVSRKYHKNTEQMILATAPIVIAGVLAIYGMIIGVMISQEMNDTAKEGAVSLTILDGGRFLAAGLSVGLACQSSGNGLYVFLMTYWYSDDEANRSCCRDGAKREEAQPVEQKEPLLLERVDNDNRRSHQQHNTLPKRHLLLLGAAPELNVRFVLSLVFMEAIGLYGLIVALVVLGS